MKQEFSKSIQPQELKITQQKRLQRELMPCNLFKTHELLPIRKEMETLNLSLHSRFMEDGRRLFDRIVDIKKKVKDIQCVIDDRIHNFSSIKPCVECAEKALCKYLDDEKESMQDLIQRESALWEECSIFKEKIELWESFSHHEPLASCGRKCYHFSNGATSDSNLPEVSRFQRYLAKHGGRTGGWHDFNHRTFLRIRNRYFPTQSNRCKQEALPVELKERFCAEVAAALCLNSPLVVAAHEEWFSRLQELESASRKAIQEYRTSKERNFSARTKARSNTVSHSAPLLKRKQEDTRLGVLCRAKAIEGERQFQKEQAQREKELLQTRIIDDLPSRLSTYQSNEEIRSSLRTKKQAEHGNFERAIRKQLTDVDKERIRERSANLLRRQAERKRLASVSRESSKPRLTHSNCKAPAPAVEPKKRGNAIPLSNTTDLRPKVTNLKIST